MEILKEAFSKSIPFDLRLKLEPTEGSTLSHFLKGQIIGLLFLIDLFQKDKTVGCFLHIKVLLENITKKHPMNAKINSYLPKGILSNLIIGVIFFTGGTFVGTYYRQDNLLSVESEAPTTQVCFTPARHCLPSVLEQIDMATEEILIQAYSFTSKEIAGKLIEAQNRGVKVRALIDRTSESSKFNTVKLLKTAGIEITIDKVPGIAHNKIIIIDRKIVITGSYNWTNAAEKRNAENLLIINNPAIAKEYLENWLYRYYSSMDQQ